MTTLSSLDYDLRTRDSHSRPAALRERGCTLVLAAVLLVQLIGCGGSKPKANPYEKAISKQQACCQGLQDPTTRQQCEESIVRLDEGSATTSEVNEATFRCVETHFVCETSTGKATQAANQATLDCLTDLSQ